MHLLQTKGVTTFDAYATDVFIPISTGSWTQLNRLMGIPMSHAAYRPGRKDAKECDERWQEGTNFQVIGLIFSVMLLTSKNSSNFSPTKLSQ